MKRSHQWKFFCLLFLVFSVSMGCSSSPPPPKPSKATKTVAFITNNYSNFWKVVQKGCEKADAELPDVTITFKIPAAGTSQEQNRILRDALDKEGADAIAISPIDPASQKKMINDAAKRALVITQDSDAPESDRALYIGADNRAAGRQAGELIKKALPKGGKIMAFVGRREVQNAQERFEGLKESLSDSKVEIIDLLTDDTDPGKARQNAFQAMKDHPDLTGMIGLWSYNCPAILQGLGPEGNLGKVKIVCFDDEVATLNAIKDGVIFGTVAQQPFEYGYQAAQAVAKILRGDRSVIPESKQILIPTVVIQRNNVDEHRNKLNQMLGSMSR